MDRPGGTVRDDEPLRDARGGSVVSGTDDYARLRAEVARPWTWRR